MNRPIVATAQRLPPPVLADARPGLAAVVLLAAIILPLVVAVWILYGWPFGLGAWVIGAVAPLVQVGARSSTGGPD
jgi:hypothetical protein